ncbi:mitotic checkpoint serine/threonine-protein kinase BUB1 isoform X2 [Hemibagrus wyckioides]|uniref:mitotic checkpoint serine/threonine-protein kinase BUB1 isoform X2 n=1 Tax=Hemibagrus wyckioides TaxID=337641 RepID=UPI00266B8B58|nr:mitotic checkpoint serine/threonine-protein kinase BUB1 isoform X2 [Hemibagrus wyckioides]
MDIDYYVQSFVSYMQSWDKDDPLWAWERFFEFMDPRLAEDEKSKLSAVTEKIIKTFLPDRRYHNDLRFISYCIRYANGHSDPVKVYNDLHSSGVGLQLAPLYISWAQQCESRNLTTEAEQVYQKALENRAEPLDTVQRHYRLLQSKRGQSQTTPSAVNTPLQDSQLVNQQLPQSSDTQLQCKDGVIPQPSEVRYVRVISRSENNPPSSSRSDTKFVSMYCVSDLVCEGSELSFEELRARRYFAKLRQQELQREQAEVMRRYEEEEEKVARMKMMLEELNSKLDVEPQDTSRPHSFQTMEDTPNPTDQSEPLSGPCASASVCEQSLTHRTDASLAQKMQDTLIAHTRASVEPRPGVCVGQETHTQAQDLLESDVFCEEEDGDVNTDVSHGVFHHSHVTPNTSLGLNSATPSRALPSPTVNTREALDLIGNMFQGPTLLQDSQFSIAHINTAAAEDSFEKTCKVTGFAPSLVKAPSSAPFRIYQDENNENGSVDPQVVFKPKPAGLSALMDIPVFTDKVTPQGAESLTDESTVSGSGRAPMAAFPNHTQELTLSAQLMSTPLHPIAPYSWDTQHSQVESGAEVNPHLRQPAKLSPIWEQSPPEEMQCSSAEYSSRAQGTIVEECLGMQRHAHSLSQPSQTNTPINNQVFAPLHKTSRLNIFQDTKPDQVDSEHSQLSDVEEADLLLPERSFNMTKSVRLLSENPQMYQWKSFHKGPQSPGPVLRAGQDVPMSLEQPLGFGWLQMKSPVQTAKSVTDLESAPQTSRPGWTIYSDQHSSSVLERSGISRRSFGEHKSEKTLFPTLIAAEKSGCASSSRGSDPVWDVPMSPGAEPGLNWICSEVPVVEAQEGLDVVMMSPQQNNKTCTIMNDLEISQKLNYDDPMSPTQPSAPPTASVLISDPWDDDLIVSLLAGLRTPLSSYPNLNTWSCRIPSIVPKLAVEMGDDHLRVDCVLGHGAFATVYQATNLDNSHKLILKVQKPSKPWEFYINTQLDVRVEASARHLYNQLYAAHVFNNGSVLIGELHNCGTLLNVVNLYKSRGEKVMPQPLLLYFTVCLLDTVERLHAARIIHADIKPDNILLGERFLENKNLLEENLEHGLVLIDFGQSIDMTLFPDGAQFMAHCMTSGFQCTEMLSGRPWTYQTDYFGVAGTVHCMLFGSYMQVRNDGGVWKTNGVFKRNPHSDLWQEFFHVLLNVPDCFSLPCLRDLRLRLRDALMMNYSSKLLGLKNRLAVQILESRPSCR